MAKATTMTIDDPRLMRQRQRAASGGGTTDRLLERQRTAVEDYNERWKIVGRCPTCEEDLIGEELVSHYMKHVNSRIRHLARMVQQLSHEQRLELLALFDPKTAELKGPLI